MAKGLKGLPLDLGAELSTLTRDAVPAEACAGGEETRQFLLGLLTVQKETLRIVEEQQAEAVRKLRHLASAERGKWSEIGKALGINPDAAMKRFTGQRKPRMIKPGYSLSEAAAMLGLSRATVYERIHNAPQDAEWFTRVATNGEVLTETFRILDIDGLASA